MSKEYKLHGGKGTKLYQVWCAMKQRCENPNSKQYKWYGAKGVSVCAEWEHDYAAFRDWAYSNGYKEGLTIDRVDTSGNYCPQNCRWATKKEQANNQTTTIKFEYNGVEKTLHEWAESIGVKPHTVPQMDKYYVDGKKEMYWDTPQDRIALVKDCGFVCDPDYFEWEDCEDCHAKEYCPKYEERSEGK